MKALLARWSVEVSYETIRQSCGHCHVSIGRDCKATPVHQLAKKPLSGTSITASLDQDIEYVTVEFVARYEDAEGTAQMHHEISFFDKVGGSWRFRDGNAPGNREPYRRTQPRLDRNDPCHCGSGKKFKKCCG